MTRIVFFRLAIAKLSVSIACLVLFSSPANQVNAQRISSTASYTRRGTAEVVIGGALMVGGVIGLDQQLQMPANNGKTQTNVALGKMIWPTVIATGSVVSMIGAFHLVKVKRLQPSISKQHIPGLDHIGIVYPKYPTIGIKYCISGS